MKRFLKFSFLSFLFLRLFVSWLFAEDKKDERPNIFFAIADDWGWPHSSSYGDAVVKTPPISLLLPVRRRGMQFLLDSIIGD
jgi:hypothetical protein